MASSSQVNNSGSTLVDGDGGTGGSVDLFYFGKSWKPRIKYPNPPHLFYQLSMIVRYCNSKNFEGYTQNKNSLHSLFGSPDNMLLLRDLPVTASLFHPRGITQLSDLAEKKYLETNGRQNLRVFKKRCMEKYKNIKTHGALFNDRDTSKETTDEVITLHESTKKILFLHHLTLMAFRSLRKSIDGRWLANPDQTVRETQEYLVPVSDIINYLRDFFGKGRNITHLKGALKWFNITMPPRKVAPAKNVCIESTLMVPTTLVLPTTLGFSTKMQTETAFQTIIQQQQNDVARAERYSVGTWTPSPLASPSCSTPTFGSHAPTNMSLDTDFDPEVKFIVEKAYSLGELSLSSMLLCDNTLGNEIPQEQDNRERTLHTPTSGRASVRMESSLLSFSTLAIGLEGK